MADSGRQLIDELRRTATMVRISQADIRNGASSIPADLKILTDVACNLAEAELKIRNRLRLFRHAAVYSEVQNAHQEVEIAVLQFVRRVDAALAATHSNAAAELLRGYMHDARSLLDLINSSLGFLQDRVAYYNSLILGAAALVLSAVAIVLQILGS